MGVCVRVGVHLNIDLRSCAATAEAAAALEQRLRRRSRRRRAGGGFPFEKSRVGVAALGVGGVPASPPSRRRPFTSVVMFEALKRPRLASRGGTFEVVRRHVVGVAFFGFFLQREKFFPPHLPSPASNNLSSSSKPSLAAASFLPSFFFIFYFFSSFHKRLKVVFSFFPFYIHPKL